MSQLPVTQEPRKRIALIVSCYNVARYLDDFIGSVDGQATDFGRLEVIAVNDGSTDDTLARLSAWRDRRPELVRIIDKPNGGLCSARNAGMAAATATWVTFIDPDDMMGPGYLAAVIAQMERFPQAAMFAANRMYYEEAMGGVVRDTHPLKSMFRDGDKLVQLDRFPEYFFHHVGAGFLRLDWIRELDLEFDPRIWPIYEDCHFNARYLLNTEASIVFVASAVYLYRRRADQSSALQGSNRHPEKFTKVPVYGYLDTLRTAHRLRGRVPDWVQNMIIYDLSWHFVNEDRASGAGSAAVGDVGREFLGHLREIRTYLDTEVIEAYASRPMSRLHRDLIKHALASEDWHTPYVQVDRYDDTTKQVRVVYRYVGAAPSEEVLFRGEPAVAVAEKRRDLKYFGQVLMSERIIWVSARGTLRVRLNGLPMPIRRSAPWARPASLRPAKLRQLVLGPPKKARRRLPRLPGWIVDENQRLKALAQTPVIKSRYAKAWVLMDRIGDADDSAEHLFRYVRKNHPKINAWFVLERGSRDWDRLVADGYEARLVAHGSRQWKLLMIHCAHLISTHIDNPIHRPAAIRALRRPDWKFTFLQHGVIKNDISAWLNTKQIDLFVTTTPAEHDSIVGDGSPYVVTEKEVKMTGLPRFDRLLDLSRRYSPDKRDLVLLAPTWRKELDIRDAHDAQAGVERFMGSDFWAQWSSLINSEEVAAACRASGRTLAFLPHPNLQAILPALRLPEHVLALSFEGENVQEYFARSACTVTDYSSMAFNSAYIDAPVVYFQFDEEAVKQGSHLGREGYFDYRADGFGPVVSTSEEAIQAIVDAARSGTSEQPYRDRVAATFPHRDGQCCERVTQAILAL